MGLPKHDVYQKCFSRALRDYSTQFCTWLPHSKAVELFSEEAPYMTISFMMALLFIFQFICILGSLGKEKNTVLIFSLFYWEAFC